MTAPGNLWFHDTVSALAYSLAQSHAQSADLEAPFNDLTQFILRQHANMPDYLRAPMVAATLGFDFIGILKNGKRFHHQPADRRQRQIAAWKNARLEFQRDLIRYFESLATVALHSRGRDAFHCVPLPADQDREAAIRVPTNFVKSPPSELRAEIVVVGSGPGGAITACLLAEAGRDVLLIEEGQFLSLESCAPFSRDEMEQKYRNGGQTVALGRNKIAYVEGRCVGGGSEINSGLYHRTPPDILERWRKEFQVEALSESELNSHFEICERDLSVSFLTGEAPAASLKLHQGAAKLGWKSLEIPRWFRYDAGRDALPRGQANHQVGAIAITGKRQSMTETYVPRFLRAGGRLLPHTRANRLHQNGSGWIVEAAHRPTGMIRIAADALFVCAGAVQSPALLRRSGITGNIGNSLQVHPTVKIVARFRDAVNAADMGVPVHQVKEFSPRLSFGCSISSPAYLALGLIDHAEAAHKIGQTWRHMAVYYAMITSEGRGTVRGLPGFRDPLVRYALTANDRRNLADGLKKLAQILFEAGATELFPGLTRGPALHCNGCLSKLPEILPDGLANLMTIHLFSSCPMGEDRSKCATDSSLLCTAPGVNPQGSIMALARRNALRFLAKS
jgi:choline dehydrogenase-like flavoprotein